MVSSQIPSFAPPLPDPPPDPILPPGVTKDLADRILNLYLADHCPTAEIGERFGLPLRTIGMILDTDYAREVCALLERLDQRRSELLAATHRIRALSATAELALTAKREETRRLAAASLLRLVPYPPPNRSGSASSPGPSSSSSSRSTPPNPVARAERSLLSAVTAALNRSIKAESDALAEEEARLAEQADALLARAPASKSSPISAERPPVAPPPPQPPPPLRPPTSSPALLDHLAARMAAPSSHPTQPPRPKSRDSPKAA